MPPRDYNTTIVLLGAGASFPAGIPTAIAMTDRMLEMFGDDALQRHYLSVARMIIGALQMSAGVRREESSANIDIERVLSAVKLLGTRLTASKSFRWGMASFSGGVGANVFRHSLRRYCENRWRECECRNCTSVKSPARREIILGLGNRSHGDVDAIDMAQGPH